MKEFLEIMEKDFLKEGFTKREWMIYGVILPVAFVAGCVIAEWISSWI